MTTKTIGQRFDGAAFSAVDATAQPQQFVEFLDRQAARMAPMRAARVHALGLQPGDAVVDVGCGPGTETFNYEQHVGPNGVVVGVDASRTMIDEATRRAGETGSRVTFRQGDARALPVDAATFDVAVCTLLLLHVADPAAAVREMVRAVRPGGRVSCSEPDHQMAIVDADDPALAERLIRHRFGRVTSPRIGRALRGLLIDAGLIDVRVELTPVPFEDWDRFAALIDLDSTVRAAVADGLCTHDAGEAVVADLGARGADGRFFGCSMMMTVSGIRPA